MADIITKLHPKNVASDVLYPDIVSENIPEKAVTYNKLGSDVDSIFNTFNHRIKNMENILMQTEIDEFAYTFSELNTSSIPKTITVQGQVYNVFKNTEVMVHEIMGRTEKKSVTNELKNVLLKEVKIDNGSFGLLSIKFTDTILRGSGGLFDYIEFISDSDYTYICNKKQVFEQKKLKDISVDKISRVGSHLFTILVEDAYGSQGEWTTPRTLLTNTQYEPSSARWLLGLTPPYDDVISYRLPNEDRGFYVRCRDIDDINSFLQYIRDSDIEVLYLKNTTENITIVDNLSESDIACITNDDSIISTDFEDLSPNVEVILQVEKVV